MDLVIERADAVDPALFEAPAEEVFDDRIDPAHLKAFLTEPNQLMCVAIAEGQIVGQVRGIVFRHPDRENELFVENLGVTPAFRRRGIATRLFAEMLEFGRERGCRDFWIGTEADNEPAKACYRSLGLAEHESVFFDGPLSGSDET